MKIYQNKLIVLLFIAFTSAQIAHYQENITSELQFEVNSIHPYIAITKEKLIEAKTLFDINPHFKSS